MKTHEGLVGMVTGAGLHQSGKDGFGSAISRALCSAGARVAVTDLDPGAAERTAACIEETGGEAFALKMDVTDPKAVATCFDAIDKRYGRCDIVVSNAGYFVLHSFCDITLEQWEGMLSVNLTGAFLVAQEGCRRMKRYGNGGVIVFISSDAGVKGAKVCSAAYSAAKAGVNGLMKAVARDGQESGIRSVAICPTVGDTPGTDAAYSKEAKSKMIKDMFSGSFIQPVEVALEVLHVSDPRMQGLTLAVRTLTNGATHH